MRDLSGDIVLRAGQRIKADSFAPKVLKFVAEGQSYREISHRHSGVAPRP
ncbi:MAG: hypothetical protein ABIO24_12655 [Saprospiraceae bacterium]